MYAFCNADDISWGTKNLDTKHADHDAKKMASKALAYQVGSSRAAAAAGPPGCRRAPPGQLWALCRTASPCRLRRAGPCSHPAAAPPTACCSPAQVRPSKTSKAFWDAMSKVQNHLTDAKSVAAYNQKKEQKMRVRRGRGGAQGVVPV